MYKRLNAYHIMSCNMVLFLRICCSLLKIQCPIFFLGLSLVSISTLYLSKFLLFLVKQVLRSHSLVSQFPFVIHWVWKTNLCDWNHLRLPSRDNGLSLPPSGTSFTRTQSLKIPPQYLLSADDLSFYFMW